MLRLLSLLCFAAPIGCGATAGTASYGSLHADYQRSLPPASASGSTGGSNPALERTSNARVLDRAAFVRAVLRQNPSIESARQGWRAALARVRQAGAFEDPMVDLGLAPLSIGSSNARVGYEVGVSQKLPWFGKRSFEAAAAAAEAEASKNDFEAMRRELALTAVVLYDQYFVATRSLHINTEHIELMRAMRGGATAQFESGRGSAQDPLQAENALAHMERDAAVLGSERDIVVAQMNELLHRDPSEPLPPPPQDLPLPPGPDVRDPKMLQTEAVASRPDIIAVRDRARAERSRADRAGREYYPDVTVSTSYNSMWDMPEHRWMIGVSVEIPLQRAPRNAAVAEAEADTLRATREHEKQEDEIRVEVQVAADRQAEAGAVLALYDSRLLPSARTRVDAALAGFVGDKNSFQVVLQAEHDLRDVELERVRAQADAHRRAAELDRAMGRVPGLGGAP
jgi:outer membrane protein, heavy metal efflux system